MNILNFKEKILEDFELKQKLVKNFNTFNRIRNKIFNCLNNSGKVFICGNGGSAAQAQHLAAEFMIRLRPNINRRPYPVISLGLDNATLTACANDYGYSKIFSRSLEGLSSKKDILITLSTSGKSKNIIEVLKLAKKKKIFSICFLGGDGGKAASLCNLKYIVESTNIAIIQEIHLFLGHSIFESVEDGLVN
jgi:D-sedoheptulose 7-phosphate isomerase